MIQLFTDEQYNFSKSGDKLPCKCEICCKTFYKMKRDIKKVYDGKKTGKYCSKKCCSIDKNQKIEVYCKTCNKKFSKVPCEIKKSKSDNHFCCKSCAAIYNSQHKNRQGNRRSKLELYLEAKLTILYPNLEIHFNHTDAINSELDIYIPSLKLAFELNGIFHYEPIYGKDKLLQIQNNDGRKFQVCIERGIEFCIIDTSNQKYFKEATSQKYLNIIINIINQRTSLEPIREDDSRCLGYRASIIPII